MRNKKFFKTVMTGVALTGSSLSLMQAQVSNVVSADNVVEVFLDSALKALKDPVNLVSAEFYDSFLRIAYSLRYAIVKALNIKCPDHYDSFRDFKQSCVRRDFYGAASSFSYHLYLKRLEFEYLCENSEMSETDKQELLEIIDKTNKVQERLKTLERGAEGYDKELYNEILDQVIDKAAICTDWDAILIDVFCKKYTFNNDKNECEKFFSNYKDKNNKYFKMGDDLYKEAIRIYKASGKDLSNLDLKTSSFNKRIILNSMKKNNSDVSERFNGNIRVMR